MKRLFTLIAIAYCSTVFAQNIEDIKKEREPYIWGDLKFGASKAEWDALVHGPLDSIGDFMYSLSPLLLNDSIYAMIIQTEKVSYEQYNSVIVYKVGNLNNVIKSKYGDGKVLQEIPEWFKIEADNPLIFKVWETGDKIILLTIERDKAYNYTGYCYIYSSSRYARRELLQEQVAAYREQQRAAANKF